MCEKWKSKMAARTYIWLAGKVQTGDGSKLELRDCSKAKVGDHDYDPLTTDREACTG
jgi:hypothetical protein